ncbi:MAG TPA: hypothetical protein VE988_17970 [Gemmataceae bacterium]|nr:hypothetical protein [Gemmataceae bacterium]
MDAICEPETDNLDQNPLYQQREWCVQAGDVQGLLDAIIKTPPGLLNVREAFEQLKRAIIVASDQEPATCADMLFRNMICFVTDVYCRFQFLCARELSRAADGADKRGMLTDDFLVHLWPQTERLQTHLATLLQSWAATNRQWDLAGRRKSKKPSKPMASDQILGPLEKLALEYSGRGCPAED